MKRYLRRSSLIKFYSIFNQMNELCDEYKQAMNENKLKFHITKLKDCEIIDDVLFRKNLL